MRRLTQEEFLAQAREVHGDLFDYSRAEFKGMNSQVLIGLPSGEFVEQRAVSHLQGKVPIQLRGEKISQALRKKDHGAHVLRELHRLFGRMYDLSRVEYRGMQTPVEIVCPFHGSFWQRPVVLLRPSEGCPECAKVLASLAKQTRHALAFRDRAISVHGERYDYTGSIYSNAKSNVTIVCPKHGPFQQAPDSHLRGAGCHTCAYASSRVSSAQAELMGFIQSLGVDAKSEYRLASGKTVDIVLDGIAIEYQGLFWHSTGSPSALPPNRHRDKRRECESAGLRYIAIYEDEWKKRRPLVESYLRAQLGQAERIGARTLRVEQIASRDARSFYAEHHFLGAPSCAHHFALIDSTGRVRAAMSGGPSTERRGVAGGRLWSLARFCTDGCSIAGGASRLFKALHRCAVEAGAVQMVSYVDLDKYQGGVYERLGFRLDAEIAPDYWTIWPGLERRHKTATKREHLAKLEGFDPALSEFQNTQAMGLFRIYHSGRLRMLHDL